MRHPLCRATVLFLGIAVAGMLSVPRAALAEPAPIVAVFNVEAKGLKLTPDVLDRLSDYLAGRLVETGRYQVVPRDQLKDRLVQKKKESYRQCYAQSCQIELGQEMAAQKTLATQVMKLGSQCKVTATLFDLARSAAETGATASGLCTEDGIVASLDAAVVKLLGGAAGRGLQTPREGTPADGGRGLQTSPGGAVSGAPMAGRAPEAASALVTAAPEVEDSGPRVKRSTVTAALGDLTIQGRTPSGTPVRLEVTDPSGKATVSGSPYKHARAAVGQWRVVAKASGHEPEEQSFQVPPDDVTVVKIDLKPFGGLRVAGEPAGSAVKVTGPGGFRDEGGLPWEAEGLRSGTYHVEVSRPGYGSDTRDVSVEPGRTATATVQLSKEEAGGGTSVGAAGIVWVSIPGGSFDMGAASGSGSEKPVHRVSVRGFQMSRTEVTVGQYRKCVNAGRCSEPKVGPNCNWGQSGREEHPINCVDWNQSEEFARWAGGRLPTEAEWEYAARSGGRDQEFPWGDAPVTCDRAVTDIGGNGCGRSTTWPVCSKPRGNTVQGLCDMAGNLWEWVADRYGSYTSLPQTDPTGPSTGNARVFRGGSWYDNPARADVADRGSSAPDQRMFSVGFRLAKSGR